MIADEQNEFQRAASGYLMWPLALATLLRDDRAASNWSRIHTRQAIAFGLLAGLGYLILLALPLVVTIANGAITTSTTVLVYAIGLAADVIVFFVLCALALRYSAKAGRGELFAIPVAGAVADRLFGKPRG